MVFEVLEVDLLQLVHGVVLDVVAVRRQREHALDVLLLDVLLDLLVVPQFLLLVSPFLRLDVELLDF